MRLIAPIILLLHWIGMLTYFTAIKYHPEYSPQYGWSVFYFTINNLTILNYGIMFMYCPACSISKQFVLIDMIFTFILALTTYLHYMHYIKYTYGFQLAVLGMIITTIMIVLSGIKHGYFKKDNV